MKKLFMILSGLLVAVYAYGQTNETVEAGCDCPSCLAKAAGETLPFTLSALRELNEPQAETNAPVLQVEEHDAHARHDHSTEGQTGKSAPHVEQASLPALAEDEHVGHDHGPEEVGYDDHAGHDHSTEGQTGKPALAEDEHAGHDHGEAARVVISEEMAEKVGLQIHEAEGGTIAKTAVFPAEIKLNRDRTAAVSPRYASIVRQVFAEIGDTVKKGDVLASLENRESMAVYTVAAPLDGIIISKDLAVGETAGDDKVLFEVADLSSVWADISIFPKYQHLLRKGMPVKFVAHDGHTARGSVKYISPIISHETRTFAVRCVLEGADEDFSPGAFVRARINVETAKVPVRVEREAVQTLNGATVVFAPGDHGFQSVDVELGLADDYSVEIKSGLKPGDAYVAVGAFALKSEMVTSGMDPHAGHGH